MSELSEKLVQELDGVEKTVPRARYERLASLSYVKSGVEYDEPALRVHFEQSVTDPTYAKSNADLIREFMQSGQTLATARLQQYDFEDGVDDGVDYPISRHISATPEEVYQSAQSTLERVKIRNEIKRLQASKREEHNEDIKQLKETLSSLRNPADKTAASQTDTGESADAR